MIESRDFAHDIRPLVRRLGKPPDTWQRSDLVDLCLEMGIQVINFRYPSLDGKLRELRLPVGGADDLDRLLAVGERVDGSSLFPSLFDTGDSDLYVVPVYRWAFLNPWAGDELDIVCRFADRSGAASPLTPDSLLERVARRLEERTGARLTALAELEFYLALQRDSDRFSGKAQRNYHQSEPYLHGHSVADEILRVSSQVIGHVKYCHSEVGYVDRIESADPELDGRRVEQYELELDLVPIEDLGCWLTVGRWLIRQIADRHGATATFAPKLDEGIAGSGLHLHLALEREGANVMRGDDEALTDDAMALMGGLLERAAPLTAFGNTVAASFLRLVPGQEAPTSICWGHRNRSSLIRVPLDFATTSRLDLMANPAEQAAYPDSPSRSTVEYRSPDGSAFPHLLLAAICLSVEDGLDRQAAIELARELEVQGDIFASDELAASLEQLPQTAVAAAASLGLNRAFFEERGFPGRLIDIVIRKLEAEADTGLTQRLKALPAAERLVASRRLMHKDLHKH